MDLNNLPLFSALSRKMNWLTERQRVLALNVSQVDTPQYKAQDLRALDFRQELAEAGNGQAGSGQLAGGSVASGQLALVTTDPNHLADTVGSSHTGELQSVVDAKPDDQQINGNTVSLEDQMMKISETAADYQLMTNLYKKQIGLLKSAIGRSGS